MATLSLGYGPDGRPLRKTVRAKTRSEVVRKMKELQRHVDDGIPLPETKLTAARLFKSWYEDVLCHQAAVSASSNYKRIFDHHIIPTLGRMRVANLSVTDVDRLISQKISTGLSVSPSKPRLR
jgi:integrase